ncbi:MAG: UDP-N-acetylmuramate--L-alanine ligase [Spirochaetota bacterium]
MHELALHDLRRVHFVGVSGSGVSAVAGLSLAMGMQVTGSANEDNNLTRALAARGMRFFLGHRAGQAGAADAVVRSAAVSPDNPEVAGARRRGVPVLLYAEYLGLLMSDRRGVAVAGTHGKTTTTALITWLLDRGGLDPLAVCGGVMSNYGSNARFGRGGYLVAEACEYHRSFLFLKPRVAMVTNIEADHLDYYRDLEEIREAFGRFLSGIHPEGCAVVNGDDPGVREVIRSVRLREEGYGTEGARGGRGAAGYGAAPLLVTVGTGPSNSYRIGGLSQRGGRYRFTLEGEGAGLHVMLPLPGRFNCINAALAVVCALRLGVPSQVIEEAVRSFRGTWRRLELLGSWRGGPVYTDYAHHPTEIASSLEALREAHPDKPLTAVFQPHQYSRTVLLFDGLVESLSRADTPVVTEVYRQRDTDEHVRSVSARDLTGALRARNPRALYAGDRDRVPGLLREHSPAGAVVLFMGAGDIDETARHLTRGEGGDEAGTAR